MAPSRPNVKKWCFQSLHKLYWDFFLEILNIEGHLNGCIQKLREFFTGDEGTSYLGAWNSFMSKQYGNILKKAQTSHKRCISLFVWSFRWRADSNNSSNNSRLIYVPLSARWGNGGWDRNSCSQGYLSLFQFMLVSLKETEWFTCLGTRCYSSNVF